MSEEWNIDETENKRVRKKIIVPKHNRIPDEKINEEYVRKCELTTMQKKILDLVYRFRMMDTKDIQRALGYKSYTRFIVGLKDLHEKRFLDRRRRPFDLRFETRGQNGEYQLFHMLDLAGVYFIKDYYGFEKLSDVKWSAAENEVKFDYAVHSLKISEAYSRLEEAINVKDDKGKKIYMGDKIIDAWSDKHLYIRYYSGREYVFYPDMFFKYKKDNKVYGFFVEIDQGTMAMRGSANTTSFDDKVVYYEGYKENKSSYMGFNNMPVCLVITTTKQRAEGLAKSVKAKQNEIGKSGVTFLFTFAALWDRDPLGRIFIDQNFETNPKTLSMFN